MASTGLASGCELAAEEGLLVQVPVAVFALESDGETSSPEGGAEVQVQLTSATSRHRQLVNRGRLASGLSLALVLCCAAAALCHHVGSTAGFTGTSDVSDSVGFSTFGGMADFLGTLADGIRGTDELIRATNETFQNMSKLANELQENAENLQKGGVSLVSQIGAMGKWKAMAKKKLATMNASQKAAFKEKFKKKLNITSWKNVIPEANLTDGNLCPDMEEMHGSLCYKRCSLLTKDFPFRTSAFSCCSHKPPCGNGTDTSTRFGICSGYSVSDHSLDRCPHAQGSCLLNEELFNGICYKSCKMITYGFLPLRNGPATCCTSEHDSRFKFLDLSGGCDTDSAEYAIGGGNGYSEKSPMEPHLPLVELTEGLSFGV
mmetsp:Transcript_82922/g.230328  ORF Transcript_82922/g.230328 Transcript_82922/m.230328 type:complete len:375 (-) Transcript_82922:89-1213(-)